MHGFARTRSASRRCTGRNCRRPSRRRARCGSRSSAASLNFPDLLIVQNKYQMKPPLPFVPGSEYAGVVEAVGEGVTHLKVGDAVAAFGGTGGFGTHASVAAAALCMPLPPGFAFDDAAAFILTYGTTHHALLDRGAAQGGRDRAGARRGRRRRHGGDPDRQGRRRARHRRRVERREVRAVPVDRRRRDHQLRAASNLRDELKALTDGKGPDVVYDPVGGDLAEPVFRSIAWRGRYLVVGFAAGRASRRCRSTWRC